MTVRRADKRQYHYIYKTTCQVTGKYYLGMHSTDNLEDGYMGSGKRLWYSINKYGKENHVCEILEFLPSRKELKLREAELISMEIISDPMCLNLKLGGEGGFDHITEQQAKENRVKGAIKANKIRSERAQAAYKNPDIVKSAIEKRIATNLDRYGKRSKGNNLKSHSDETKRKMSESHKSRNITGENNSQFGSCWITNGNDSIKISKENIDDYILIGWNLGRKMKRNNDQTPKE